MTPPFNATKSKACTESASGIIGDIYWENSQESFGEVSEIWAHVAA